MAAGSFAYDNANRLASDARSTYTYDNEGDLTSKTDKTTNAGTTYTWNMRHQLTSIAFSDGTSTTYRYDPMGRRIESNASAVVTRDIYDGQNLRLQYDGNNLLSASFVDAGLDGHLEETQAGQRLFFLQDGSNSAVQLTNSSGASVASYAYDSFGVPAVSNSNNPANPFTYTGREFDTKSGLYYYRSRYYAPDQGRFISEDPVAHLNAYTYTQNDPVDFGDPSGAVLTEYAVLTASTQKFNIASCISAAVGAAANVAQAGVGAAFDQPGAAASAAQRALVAGAIETGVACALAAVPAGEAEAPAASKGPLRLVIGRTKDLLKPGSIGRNEYTLLGKLSPSLGSPKANWYRNASVLRGEIRQGIRQVRDASPGDYEGQFTNAERNILQNRGWTYDPETHMWNAPG
jgi:RHS repeat-associated protein